MISRPQQALYPIPGFAIGYTFSYIDFVRHRHEVASCLRCGEAHHVTVNEHGQRQLQVNGHVVRECINCNYHQTGAVTW